MAKPSRLPVLVGLSDIAHLTGSQMQTVYRWNMDSPDRPRVLPEPESVVNDFSGSKSNPLWRLDTIEEWARETGRTVDEGVAAIIRAAR